MFDIGWQELFIVALIVIIVVGPKDLPRVLKTIGVWVAKAKSMARDFQGHIDDMVAEAELDDVKQKIGELGSASPGQILENTIDPDGELRDAAEFGDDFEDFATSEFDADDEVETHEVADPDAEETEDEEESVAGPAPAEAKEREA